MVQWWRIYPSLLAGIFVGLVLAIGLESGSLIGDPEGYFATLAPSALGGGIVSVIWGTLTSKNIGPDWIFRPRPRPVLLSLIPLLLPWVFLAFGSFRLWLGSMPPVWIWFWIAVETGIGDIGSRLLLVVFSLLGVVWVLFVGLVLDRLLALVFGEKKIEIY